MYVDFPYLREGFPICFEDDKYVYHIQGDVYSNYFKVFREEQKSNAELWAGRKKRVAMKLQRQGFKLPETFNVLVSISKVERVDFDSQRGTPYKVYEPESQLYPLSMVVRSRNPHHYLNLTQRMVNPLAATTKGKQLVCLNNNNCGVIGTCDEIDLNK